MQPLQHISLVAGWKPWPRRGDPQRFAQRAMIAAACGLGLLDPASTRGSFTVARGVSRLVRSLADVAEEILEEA
jgi:hypothetical protein